MKKCLLFRKRYITIQSINEHEQLLKENIIMFSYKSVIGSDVSTNCHKQLQATGDVSYFINWSSKVC